MDGPQVMGMGGMSGCAGFDFFLSFFPTSSPLLLCGLCAYRRTNVHRFAGRFPAYDAYLRALVSLLRFGGPGLPLAAKLSLSVSLLRSPPPVTV